MIYVSCLRPLIYFLHTAFSLTNACQIDLDQVLDDVLAQIPTGIYIEGTLACPGVHTEDAAAASASAKHHAAAAAAAATTTTKSGRPQEKRDTPIDGE